MPKKTGVVRRVPSRTKVAPISAGATVGKMRLYRKIVKDECVDILDVVGVHHMKTAPTRSVARRISCNI